MDATLLSQGIHFHQTGAFDRAAEIYEQLIRTEAANADAPHLLGLIRIEQGQVDNGIELIQRAIKLGPGVSQYHANLTQAYLNLKRGKDALAAAETGLRRHKNDLLLLQMKGEALALLDRRSEAIACFRQKLKSKPGDVDTLSALAQSLKETGEVNEARKLLEAIVQACPDRASDVINYAQILRIEQLDEAESMLARFVARRPGVPEAYNAWGSLLVDQGRLDEGVNQFRQAITCNSSQSEYRLNLGSVLYKLGRSSEAAHEARIVVQECPQRADAHNLLGTSLQKLDQIDEAEESYRKAIECDPACADAHSNLGVIHTIQGRFTEAICSFKSAVNAKPDYAVAYSNMLQTLQFEPPSRRELLDAHREWHQRFAAHIEPQVHVPKSSQLTRLGFVSPSFGRHPVGFFTTTAITGLDQSKFETFIYSDRLNPDDYTAKLEREATHFKMTRALSDEELAQQITRDGIDILFDLGGHTEGNRQFVFARRPAPIQIKWVGYAGSTGLKTIDYLLADRFHVPAEHEPDYHESILRMPNSYVCYLPPSNAPHVAGPPVEKCDHVTFGSLNQPSKLNPAVIALWSRILNSVPDSQLILRFRWLETPSIQKHIWSDFESHGISKDRVELLAGCSHREFLETYHRIDIALDPFPFSGGITTAEALWMGVPVISCAGETFAGRHSLSYLSTVGLPELICESHEQYFERAVQLANDTEAIAHYRRTLRNRTDLSPLCNGTQFTRDFETLIESL